ncbi:MAG: hypothetical protein JSU86_09450 [Phycisphaerales bacterium]|nr:MAG: hypothetical protein JSU86_09450 [Phycisphaerales bacterium]
MTICVVTARAERNKRGERETDSDGAISVSAAWYVKHGVTSVDGDALKSVVPCESDGEGRQSPASLGVDLREAVESAFG